MLVDMDTASMLLECGASLVFFDGRPRLCRRAILSKFQPEMLNTTRKRKASEFPDLSCPGWERGQGEEKGEDEEEPVIQKRGENILAKNEE